MVGLTVRSRLAVAVAAVMLLSPATTAFAGPTRRAPVAAGRTRTRSGRHGARTCAVVPPPKGPTAVRGRELTRLHGGVVDLTAIVNAGPASPLAKSAAWMGGINLLGFIISAVFKNCHYVRKL